MLGCVRRRHDAFVITTCSCRNIGPETAGVARKWLLTVLICSSNPYLILGLLATRCRMERKGVRGYNSAHQWR